MYIVFATGGYFSSPHLSPTSAGCTIDLDVIFEAEMMMRANVPPVGLMALVLFHLALTGGGME